MTSSLRPRFWSGPVRRWLLWTIVSSLTLPPAAVSQAARLTATQIDGTQQSGHLVNWNADALTIRSDDRSLTIASPQLLRAEWHPHEPRITPSEKRAAQSEIKIPPSDPGGVKSGDDMTNFIVLVDGTRLPCQAYQVEAGQATIGSSLSDQPLTISTERIRWVQLQADAGPRELAGPELAGDLLVVRKKDGNALDYLSGILGDVSREQVEFNWDGDLIPVKRSKIAALAYFHAGQPEEIEPVFWLTLRNGARLPVRQIALANAAVKISTVAGLDLAFPVNLVQSADYSQGKLAYLSDLEPLYQQWTPRINLPAAAELIRQHGLPRRDQSFAGSALTLFWPGGAPDFGAPNVGKPHAGHSGVIPGELLTYRKGMAVRSRTELRYRVPAGMQRFVALAGIDPDSADQGDVTLEIFADQRSVWHDQIDGTSVPAEIDVPLGAARELRIVVDYGGNLDFGDRLHLVEARLSR